MPGTLKQACVLLPLGSPTGLRKRSYVHVPGCPRAVRGTAVSRTCSQVGTRVGIAGWVPGWAIPGTTQPLLALSQQEPQPAERAPEAPQGLEWVGWGGLATPSRTWCTVARGRPCTHPPGPVGPLQGPPWYRTSQSAT